MRLAGLALKRIKQIISMPALTFSSCPLSMRLL